MMENFEAYLNAFNEKLEKIPFVANTADQMGVKPALIGIVFVAFVCGFLIFGVGGSIIANIVGFLYPAYESFRVMESGSSDEAKMRFWLT